MKKSIQLLLLFVLSCYISFSQATKEVKKLPPLRGETIADKVHSAIDNNKNTAKEVSILVATTKKKLKLYAIVSKGELLRFKAIGANGKVLKTSIQRDDLTCVVCIIQDWLTVICFAVKCDDVLKVPPDTR